MAHAAESSSSPRTAFERVLAALVFAALAVGLAGLALVGERWPERLVGAEDGPPLCLFWLVTGWRCPLCGMTRATLHLARHDLPGALHIHPLAPVVLVLVFGVAFAWLGYAAAGRSIPPRLRARKWWIAVAAAVWIVNLLFGSG